MVARDFVLAQPLWRYTMGTFVRLQLHILPEKRSKDRVCIPLGRRDIRVSPRRTVLPCMTHRSSFAVDELVSRMQGGSWFVLCRGLTGRQPLHHYSWCMCSSRSSR